jgi:hypothetical protein
MKLANGKNMEPGGNGSCLQYGIAVKRKTLSSDKKYIDFRVTIYYL